MSWRWSSGWEPAPFSLNCLQITPKRQEASNRETKRDRCNVPPMRMLRTRVTFQSACSIVSAVERVGNACLKDSSDPSAHEVAVDGLNDDGALSDRVLLGAYATIPTRRGCLFANLRADDR